jgi:hypothetical protein
MDGIPISNVERGAFGLSASFSNLIPDFVGSRLDHIVDRYLGTGIGQGESDRSSDSLTCSCDQRTPTF